MRDSLPQHIHLIGINGSGMTGLAEYLLGLGKTVTGSDLNATRGGPLEQKGATVFHGHRSDHINGAGMVVYSDAVPFSNPELAEARIRDLPMVKRAQCLGRLLEGSRAVAVSGSHGKSSTTTMIANILRAGGHDASHIVGAPSPCLDNAQGRRGASDIFVFEACEAFQNLAPLSPDIALILNIDDDHIEHYGSVEKLLGAFRDFAGRIRDGGALIVNGEDARARDAAAAASVPVTTFGLSAECDVHAADIAMDGSGSTFSVIAHGAELGALRLKVPGRHMVGNALACVAACLALDVPFAAIRRGFEQFTGVSRRWQMHGEVHGLRLIDDYAHHPTELRACLETAKLAAAHSGSLCLAFQPQLYSRTRRLFAEYVEVLKGFDRVGLVEIDGAGEKNTSGVSVHHLADALREAGKTVLAFPDAGELLRNVSSLASRGDTLIVAGAGNIRQAVADFAKGGFALEPQSQSGALPGAANETPSANGKVRAFSVPEADDGERDTDWLGRARPKTVLDLFNRHVRRNPDAPAVSGEAGTLSYRELDLTASRFAVVLLERGVEPGATVGVSLPSSVELIIAIVAIAKIGGVYLPLDASLPPERVKYMLRASHAPVLLTRSQSAHDLPAFGVRRCYIERLLQETLFGEPSLESLAPRGGDAAYICFTSGSTGKPKGIAISHRSLFLLCKDITRRFKVRPGARVSINTSISFDISLGEIWMSLTGGSEAVVTDWIRPLVGQRLADFINDRRITHLSVTPSILMSVPVQTLRSLKCIVSVGEALPDILVRRWARGQHLVNAYGPTEATIYATAALCRRKRPVTIGRQLGHVRTLVLDQNLVPVAKGEIGELCLEGPGVARGYIAGTEGSSNSFVTRHRAGRESVLYRTGDMVRKDRWGRLLYLGRADNQIKINGNRIELEEIESRLREAPGVRDAVVCVRTVREQKDLVAFVVLEADADLPSIRARLASWFSEAMLPRQIIEVPEIRLTPSGKKDRNWALANFGRRAMSRAVYTAPETKPEQKLLAIWKTVLAPEFDIGVYDSFHRLGGDSLQFLLMIEEVERTFGVRVPPGAFHAGLNALDMAAAIETMTQEKSGDMPADGSFESGLLYKRLKQLTFDWSGERRTPGSLIMSHISPRARYQLFICAQLDEEIEMLAHALGPDFSVHGMRSGHLVMEYSEAQVGALAEYYLQEMLPLLDGGEIVMAGVCQGSLIMREMALRLAERHRPPKLFVVIEQFRLFAYPGPIALFYSEDGFLNPMRRFESRLERYDQIYGDSYTVDLVPGVHGDSLREPNVHHFARALRARLEDAPAAASNGARSLPSKSLN
ncbi:UDP-N-acetylmuramate--L-alanine ligase [[Pseudomonas] carboxydohydrogena]|uniref:UDP-N-acetylmuramate--L-alanine ligase n=1 Tax=Afipia carboxydohydrogena TaxID=290 RepID=A0ABY8BPH5_AFICR|nr:UDP-N-acetylmuramate--L-alanine ligase [[Pseudomonas] carboxydohydrogena]WEF51880.1 UDP-N-acetylmuramate--L-alanine ligase [[Pseudomonas] carboxydohydrogena]